MFTYIISEIICGSLAGAIIYKIFNIMQAVMDIIVGSAILVGLIVYAKLHKK